VTVVLGRLHDIAGCSVGRLPPICRQFASVLANFNLFLFPWAGYLARFGLIDSFRPVSEQLHLSTLTTATARWGDLSILAVSVHESQWGLRQRCTTVASRPRLATTEAWRRHHLRLVEGGVIGTSVLLAFPAGIGRR
jgi:hypothetical protein